MMGLLTGTVLGAGLGMLLAPKAGSELRGAIGEQARNLGNMASDGYRRASEQAGGWAEKGRDFAEKAREAVVKGADEARSYTTGTSGSGSSSIGSTSSPSSFGSSSSNIGSGGDFGRS